VAEPFAVDFAAHAAAMGALAETVTTPPDLAEAFRRAKAADRTTFIVMQVDPYEGWTAQGHAWWEVGTPEVSTSAEVAAAHEDWEASRHLQRQGL
jgi:3D-(3,5/4)-trihydroxycyclohexane-1,2-dione acylhydrolase (decyclizing)